MWVATPWPGGLGIAPEPPLRCSQHPGAAHPGYRPPPPAPDGETEGGNAQSALPADRARDQGRVLAGLAARPRCRTEVAGSTAYTGRERSCVGDLGVPLSTPPPVSPLQWGMAPVPGGRCPQAAPMPWRDVHFAAESRLAAAVCRCLQPIGRRGGAPVPLWAAESSLLSGLLMGRSVRSSSCVVQDGPEDWWPCAGWKVMSHARDEPEACPVDGGSGRSSTIGVTHAVLEAVDDHGGDGDLSELASPVAGLADGAVLSAAVRPMLAGARPRCPVRHRGHAACRTPHRWTCRRPGCTSPPSPSRWATALTLRA